MLTKNKNQVAEALNDAAKTLEFCPLDSIETEYKYFLLFKTREQAELVGEHALMVIKTSDNEHARSLVVKVHQMTAHQLSTHEDGWLVTLTFHTNKKD